MERTPRCWCASTTTAPTSICDDETQTLYDYVDYPITLTGDPWEEFQSIDFADRNGDGNGDVAMLFELDGAAGADGVVLGRGQRELCVPAGGIPGGGLR